MQHILVYDIHILHGNRICLGVKTGQISQEKAECVSELADVISGSREYRGANGHLREDIGLSYPPAQDVSSVGRFFAVVFSSTDDSVRINDIPEGLGHLFSFSPSVNP